MSDTQQAPFAAAILPYNALMYPLGILVMLPWALRLRKWCHAPGTKDDRQFFRFPAPVIAVITIGWLPGAIFFPYMITGGQWDPTLYWHFALSFVFSWLIATSYSVLMLQWLICQHLVPQCARPPYFANHQTVEGIFQRGTVLRISAALIPLLAAVLVTAQSPLTDSSTNYTNYLTFQFCVLTLMAVGLIGFILAVRMTESCELTVRHIKQKARTEVRAERLASNRS